MYRQASAPSSTKTAASATFPQVTAAAWPSADQSGLAEKEADEGQVEIPDPGGCEQGEGDHGVGAEPAGDRPRGLRAARSRRRRRRNRPRLRARRSIRRSTARERAEARKAIAEVKASAQEWLGRAQRQALRLIVAADRTIGDHRQSDGEQSLRTAGSETAGREAIAANVEDDDRGECSERERSDQLCGGGRARRAPGETSSGDVPGSWRPWSEP